MSDPIRKYFTSSDFDRLEEAVARAERRTEGEIALTITRSSSHVWHDGWLASAFLGLATALFCMVITYDSGWGELYDYAFAASSGAATFALAWVLWRLPGLRTGTSKGVWKKALSRFEALQPTRARTGVLLYISLEEHQVAVVADSAIAERLPADYWDIPRDRILQGFRDGRPTAALILAILEIGERLAEHFPRPEDDRNELPNRPHIDS